MKTIQLRMMLPDKIADRFQKAAHGDEGDWERLQQVFTQRTTPSEEETLSFCTPNLTLEEYAVLPLEEKSRYRREAEAANREWIERELQQHKAVWIAVIDGQVVASSPQLPFPDGPRIRELGAATGKQAFIFVDKSRFVIEETVSWNATRHADDVYPTVPLTVAHESDPSSVSIVADFDTGSTYTYLPFDELAEQGVVKQRDENELTAEFSHLSQPFECLSRFVLARLATSSPLVEYANGSS
jgi:hypothetical protein